MTNEAKAEQQVIKMAREQIADIYRVQDIMRRHGYVPGPGLDRMISERELLIISAASRLEVEHGE